jgi:perosamine synthetase
MIPTGRPSLGAEELNAIKEVLESGMMVQGQKVAAFEKAFAEYLGVKNAVAVNSGTAALHVALIAMGVKPGKEVVVPPLTFFATASTVLMCGGRPTFADVEKDLYTMDPRDAKKALSPRTKVIIPVHLYGQSADMDPLLELAREKGLVVLEDAAQAHGAVYKGRKAGSMGDAACFSFYATKTMTTGEGGMVVTNDDEIARKCRLLRDQGQESKYEHVLLGYNYRMTEVAAALGLVQLRRLDNFITRRKQNAAILTNGLGGIGSVTPPVEGPDRLHTYYQYILRLEQDFPCTREGLIGKLGTEGISSKPSYPVPLYRQKALKGMVRARKCRVAEEVIPKLLELPVHPLVPRNGLETAVAVIRSAAGQ